MNNFDLNSAFESVGCASHRDDIRPAPGAQDVAVTATNTTIYGGIFTYCGLDTKNDAIRCNFKFYYLELFGTQMLVFSGNWILVGVTSDSMTLATSSIDSE
jgi:hypothetical protein